MFMVRVATCAACALLVAVPASSQSPDVSPSAPAHSTKLKKTIGLWAAAVGADQMTTYWFSSRYHDLLHEENPLVKGLDDHPVWLVSTGSAIDAASGWAAWRVLGDRHPRLAKVVFYAAAAYRSYLAGSNIEMMRRARAVRARTSLAMPLRQ